MPILLLSFTAIIAALWFYVLHFSAVQNDGLKRNDVFNDPALTGRVKRDVRDSSAHEAALSSAGQPTNRRVLWQQLERRWAAWKQSVDRLASNLDETSVRIRNRFRKNSFARMMAGWSSYHTGRPQVAVRHFDRVLKRQPDHVAALFGKATALTALRQYQQAADAFDELATLDPSHVEARYNHAVLLARLGDLGSAARRFREVTQLQPKHAKAHYNLAGLAQRDGRLTEARDAWQAFTRLQPKVAGGWFNLGIIHLDLEQPREAAKCFSYLTLIRPNDADAHANLALAYLRAHDLDAALSALKTANELSPCDPAILETLADVHQTIAEWHPPDEDAHRAKALAIKEQIEMLKKETDSERVAERSEEELP